MVKRYLGHGVAMALALALAAMPQGVLAQDKAGALIPTEQFRLKNGLKVIFHIDRSDPVVAVSLNAHVGSARETPGRTGFAHMFEHLFFLESENLGKGGLDKLSARIGGSGAGGSTNRDLTDYYQTVPNDALEKMIWAEADKLGYFINTVTDPVLAKEKQVVKNEKRQRVDNAPYGHSTTIIPEALYPADHPYHWPVIGSLADLDAATLEDVRAFYRRWYVPNNVTLVIAGDFDTAQAKAWIHKYFDEIPGGAAVPEVKPRLPQLAADRDLFHEDNFAKLPLLSYAWPAPTPTDPDFWPTRMLSQLLADGRKAPLHAVIVDDKKLADEVAAFIWPGQVASEMRMEVRAFDGVDLDRVEAAFDEGLAKFERNGIDEKALARLKTQAEVSVYKEMASVEGKASAIAYYDLMGGDPAWLDRDLAALRAVTKDDVMRAYRRYLKGRPRVSVSMVPKGEPGLALNGATRATIVEEQIVQGAEEAVDTGKAAAYTRTPSTFDRTIEPPYGAAPRVVVPDSWTRTLANGLVVSGIEDREVPLVSFELAIDGGRSQDEVGKPGVAAMTARMMNRGTAKRTPAELEDALKDLGANVTVQSRDEQFVIAGTTLARNIDATMALVGEMLLQPRWDSGELVLAKAAAAGELADQMSEPTAIAQRVAEVVTYGEGHVFGRHRLGTDASIKAMTMDDLKAYHAAKLAPNVARLRFVGAVKADVAAAASQRLASGWSRRTVAPGASLVVKDPAKAEVYFYDVPDAKQSSFYFTHSGPRRADADAYPVQVMNYRLGSGNFASRLTQELREGKGYTYNVSGTYDQGRGKGEYRLRSGVRANVTFEAAELARQIMADYGRTFTEDDLAVTKSFLTKARARSFETATAKLTYLGNLGDYGLSKDYPTQEQAIVDGMTVAKVRGLAERYVRPQAMRYVVVGDAKTQEARLKELGLGTPVRVNDLVDRLAK